MNISTRSKRPLRLTHQVPTPEVLGPERCSIAPAQEMWEVNGERYTSTADLVANISPPEGSIDASHIQPPTDTRTKVMRIGAAVGGGALLGAGMGAVLYGTGTVAGGIGHFLMDVGGVGYGNTGGVLGFGQAVAIGAATVAAVGGLVTIAGAIFDGESEIKGKLVSKPGPGGEAPHLHFVPGWHKKSVDLPLYAKASNIEEPDKNQWWRAHELLADAYDAGYGGHNGVEDY